VMPFVVGIFNMLGNERLLIGGTLLAYLLSCRFLETRAPPVLPALLVGLVLVALTGRLGHVPTGWSLPGLALAHPTFSVRAIATIVPVIVPLIALQSNLTWVAYTRNQGYRPPARVVDVATGIGTMLGAFVGPAPICMGSAVVPLAAGPEAGERAVRHWSVYAAAAGFALVALGASIAAGLPSILPLAFLLAVAGLALIGALGQALGDLARGPLRLGPLFAFVIASSKLSLFGLGPLFWALVGGTAIAYLLEPEGLRSLRTLSL
jgi:benzoate membrane transport protein